MKKYIVYTAGFPEEKEEIYTTTPLEAAKSFFMNHKCKNSIVVKWGVVWKQDHYVSRTRITC